MVALEKTATYRILLGVDGSEHSIAAATFLKDLDLPDNTWVIALSALDPRQASNHAAHLWPLKKVDSILQAKDIRVTTELVLGYPSELLAKYAEEYQPHLIALGAKGLRATLGILLGGVAQQVVEYSNQPVLIVRAPYSGLRRVLLVVDGSQYSQLAATFLTQFPLPAGINLIILHVLPPHPIRQPEMIGEGGAYGPQHISRFVSDSFDEEAVSQAEESEGMALLGHVETKIKAGLDNTLTDYSITTTLLRGDAATEIIQYSKEQQIDLIVSGSRGLSQVKGWMLGSVSRKIVHYSGCSTLIVKGTPNLSKF